MAHLLSTVTASTAIVCGGLVTHIASCLAELEFRDTTPINPAALISITFLKNAHDILFYESRGGVNTYQWILHPNPDNVTLFLPSPGINNRLSRQLHYCLPGALPSTIVSYLRKEERRQQRRREGRNSDESEDEEDEESEEEEEGEEENEEETGERPSHSGLREEIQPQPSSSHHFTQPQTSPTPHEQPIPTPSQAPPFPYSYFDQRFDQVMAGQQQIMERLNSMSLTFTNQYEDLSHRMTDLEKDHQDLLRDTYWLTQDINAIWNDVFLSPQLGSPPDHGWDGGAGPSQPGSSPHGGQD